MTILYNCKHAGDEYRITKFNDSMDVESSYLCTFTECDCPAGVRDTCRHRQMLPKFIQRNAVGSPWFYDHDRDGWVHTDLGEALSESLAESLAGEVYTAGTATGSVDIAGEMDKAGFATPMEATFAPAKPFRRGL